MMSKDEVLDLLLEMSKPLELQQLIADGILKKSGAWYIIVKHDKIPQHVWRHVSVSQQISQSTGGKERSIVKVKFKDASKSSRNLYSKITGRQVPE